LRPYDALLVLGDSNTRQAFFAVMTLLSPDVRTALCPVEAPVWNPAGANERRYVQENGGRAPADAAAVAALLCRLCYDGRRYAVSPEDPCRNFYPNATRFVRPAQVPCTGAVPYQFFSCGECGPGVDAVGPMAALVAAAAQYRNPLLLVGFGIHLRFNITRVLAHLAPLLAYLAQDAAATTAASRGPRLVWLEPLSRDEKLVPGKYLALGQNNTKLQALNAAVLTAFRPLGRRVLVASGVQVSPSAGAPTPDGTHMSAAANLARATLVLRALQLAQTAIP
jgi:hypothetical protein